MSWWGELPVKFYGKSLINWDIAWRYKIQSPSCTLISPFPTPSTPDFPKVKERWLLLEDTYPHVQTWLSDVYLSFHTFSMWTISFCPHLLSFISVLWLLFSASRPLCGRLLSTSSPDSGQTSRDQGSLQSHQSESMSMCPSSCTFPGPWTRSKIGNSMMVFKRSAH